MKSLKVLGSAGATGVVMAALIVMPAFACRPQGKIVKTVQDVTTKSAVSDANDEAHALSVTQGDVLTYTVTVSNQETEIGSKGEDEMTNTTLTDTLPAGVELVSNPGQSTITENLGTIKAKGSVTKSYQVKVTATTDGATLTNKACYTSNSNLGSQYNQNGCEVAVVKVTVPKTPTPPVTPPATPVTPAAPTAPTPTPEAPTATPTALPSTGATTYLAPLAAVVTAGAAYVARLKFLSRESA
jgi:uncharacterized repeat protein (TIGR01451 family)